MKSVGFHECELLGDHQVYMSINDKNNNCLIHGFREVEHFAALKRGGVVGMPYLEEIR